MNIFKIENINSVSDVYFIFSALDRIYKEGLKLTDKDFEEFMSDLDLYWEDNQPLNKCRTTVEVINRVFTIHDYINNVYRIYGSIEKYDGLLSSFQSNMIHNIYEELKNTISKLMCRFNKMHGIRLIEKGELL